MVCAFERIEGGLERGSRLSVGWILLLYRVDCFWKNNGHARLGPRSFVMDMVGVCGRFAGYGLVSGSCLFVCSMGRGISPSGLYRGLDLGISAIFRAFGMTRRGEDRYIRRIPAK